MCKVVLSNPDENVDFIIYNHLFSKDNYKFTVSQLLEDLRQYRLNLTQEFVQTKVNALVASGLVDQHLRCYVACGR